MIWPETYSVKMQQICQMIIELGPTEAPVLIEGEEGTEKELIAKAIHLNSARSREPFVSVDCEAYPQMLLESELFGHEIGAFYGATERKKGRFEIVDKGTIFLNNIELLSPISQLKLLRLLETQVFERLGGSESIPAQIRIMAGSKKNLKEETEKGTFLEEVYYRLGIITIVVPPLRERREDIPLLIEYFLHELAKQSGEKTFSNEAIQLLMSYSWPENVKELENTVQYAYLMSSTNVIDVDALPNKIKERVQTQKTSSFEENEREFLLKMLKENNWNKLQVAKKLHISRSTLYAKLRKYNLMEPIKN